MFSSRLVSFFLYVRKLSGNENRKILGPSENAFCSSLAKWMSKNSELKSE